MHTRHHSNTSRAGVPLIWVWVGWIHSSTDQHCSATNNTRVIGVCVLQHVRYFSARTHCNPHLVQRLVHSAMRQTDQHQKKHNTRKETVCRCLPPLGPTACLPPLFVATLNPEHIPDGASPVSLPCAALIMWIPRAWQRQGGPSTCGLADRQAGPCL